jgi:hypothetical protein
MYCSLLAHNVYYCYSHLQPTTMYTSNIIATQCLIVCSLYICLLMNITTHRPDADVFERALKSSGDLLVTFMGEQDTYRVNHRFMRPFIGGSKDALIARASKGNKNLIQAIRMATKKLILERQVCAYSTQSMMIILSLHLLLYV